MVLKVKVLFDQLLSNLKIVFKTLLLEILCVEIALYFFDKSSTWSLLCAFSYHLLPYPPPRLLLCPPSPAPRIPLLPLPSLLPPPLPAPTLRPARSAKRSKLSSFNISIIDINQKMLRAIKAFFKIKICLSTREYQFQLLINLTAFVYLHFCGGYVLRGLLSF
jgi:hypothetical protein